MSIARRVATVALAVCAAVVAPAAGGGPAIDDLTWSPLFGSTGSPMANAAVWAITVDGDDVYVGGEFTDFAGIAAADRIARWNGSTQEWEALAPDGATDGSIDDGKVYSISVSDGVVYVGGDYSVDTAAGTCSNLSAFNLSAQTWSGFSSGSCPADEVIDSGDRVYAVRKIAGGPLYVGGMFTDANGEANYDYAIYGIYDGTSWSWSGLSDDGSGGPALSAFVSNFAVHPDGGVLVTGDFGGAGGVAGANSNAHFDIAGPAWIAQDTPAVTYYGALNTGTNLYVSGWEGAYLNTSGTSWRALCTTELGVGSATWGALAELSSGVLLVGGSNGLYACDTAEGGAATVVPNSGTVRALASYRGATIVGSSTVVGDAGTDFIAVLGEMLPFTNSDSRRTVDSLILLASLAAFTALAGTQLLRRA